MAATQVQKKSYASSSAGTSHNITLDATATSGNLLIMGVTSDATVNTPSGWTQARAAVNDTGTYIYYKTSAGTESTITVSPTASAQTVIAVLEYSGMAASSQLDKTASTTPGTVSSIATGTTATTAQADELLIALAGWNNSAPDPTFSSWSNSFTSEATPRSTGSGVLVRLAFATRVVSATGTYSSTATLSGNTSNPSGAIATFKIAATTGSLLIPPRHITRLIMGGF